MYARKCAVSVFIETIWVLNSPLATNKYHSLYLIPFINLFTLMDFVSVINHQVESQIISRQNMSTCTVHVSVYDTVIYYFLY